jgi:PST family polysaccharide transporter
LAEQRYLSGVVWSAINAAAGVLLPLAIFVLFARLLAPAEVGVIVLAVAWTEIIKGLGAPGLYEALLQQREDDERHHQTALAVLLAAGLLLFPLYLAIIALTLPSDPKGAPGLLELGVIGLRIVFDLATLQPQARLARGLSYRRLGTRSVVANAVAGVVGVGIALLGGPMLGLILYQVGQSALLFLTTALGTGTLAMPRFHRDCARSMAREAGLSTANRFIGSAVNHLDQVAVGAVLDARRVAYLNLAKRGETSIITVAVSFNSILFQPLFARPEARPGERAEGITRGLAILTLACGLPTAVFAVNSGTVVTAVFGAQWTAAAPVAAAMALSGFARALGFVHMGLLSVSGRNHVILLSSGVAAAVSPLLVLGLAPVGLVWCAAALAARSVVVTAWLAHATRADARRPLRIYLFDVLAPFALMLAGAGLGRWAAGAALTGTAGALEVLLPLAASATSAALLAGPYFLSRHHRLLVSLRRAQVEAD